MTQETQNSRRKFIKTAGKAAVVAPAAMLILNAAVQPAVAQVASGQRPPAGTGQVP